jgi:hypothetical protein
MTAQVFSRVTGQSVAYADDVAIRAVSNGDLMAQHFRPRGQLWERVAEGLIHEDLSRIAHAVNARRRAGAQENPRFRGGSLPLEGS